MRERQRGKEEERDTDAKGEAERGIRKEKDREIMEDGERQRQWRKERTCSTTLQATKLNLF